MPLALVFRRTTILHHQAAKAARHLPLPRASTLTVRPVPDASSARNARSGFREVTRRFFDRWEARPVLFGAVFAMIKTSAADLLVQTYVEKSESIDWRRNCVFGSFGLVYLGCVQYWVYSVLFPRYMFPRAAAFVQQPFRLKMRDFAGQRTVAYQVAMDMLVHGPFMYYPAFYVLKEGVESRFANTFWEHGLRKWWKNFLDDEIAYILTWGPAFVINFAFVPIYMRMPFTAVVSMVWTVFLSSKRGQPELLEEEGAAAVDEDPPAASPHED